MTAGRINRVFQHAAGRLDDNNDALILNIDIEGRVAEIIDEVKYERDGLVETWGHIHWKIQGDKFYMHAISLAGGGIYRSTVTIDEQDFEDDLMEALGDILACIQHDYIDEGP